MSKQKTIRTSDAAASDGASAPEPEYKVGPGRPPKQYWFKKGQSGNPKGAKRKEPSPVPDLRAVLQAAIGKSIKIKQGDLERTVTMATAGIEQLVALFVKGDRHARRDLFALAEKLGVDLIAGQSKAMQEALVANHQAILDSYVARKSGKASAAAPVFAPPELLDDDPVEPNNPPKKKED